VRGPLNVARMPQGRPILVQAGASEQGRDIAAESADVVYASQDNVQAMKAYYDDVKGRMAKYGRDWDDLKIMPGIRPIVGATRAEAQAKYDALQELVDPVVGLARVYNALGDLSGYPIDGPVPEPVMTPQIRSSQERLMKRVKENNWTIRQLCQVLAGEGSSVIVGTAADIADRMEEFIKYITPELQRRGRFRTAYEGKTLRENLGLKPHVNRYVAERERQAGMRLASD
jgi:alkanesulfonate monooxygenase SsuD/methylene tetrahydromethanopterin reductase-like flavin-dependent oxidoreductase (luciferase family)